MWVMTKTTAKQFRLKYPKDFFLFWKLCFELELGILRMERMTEDDPFSRFFFINLLRLCPIGSLLFFKPIHSVSLFQPRSLFFKSVRRKANCSHSLIIFLCLTDAFWWIPIRVISPLWKARFVCDIKTWRRRTYFCPFLEEWWVLFYQSAGPSLSTY